MQIRSKQVQMLCEAGIMVALALVLGLLKLYEFPQGGSISLEMLPLFVFCIRWGFGYGLIACTAFGVLQVFVQGAVSYGWVSILLDYIVAFMPLCLCGLGRGKPGGIFWGSALGALARFLVHFISVSPSTASWRPPSCWAPPLTTPISTPPCTTAVISWST